MILDNETLFSDAQAVTATAASTNIIDLAPIGAGIVRDIGPGKAIPVVVQVVTDFTAAGSATMVVALQTDDNSSFSSAKTVVQTAAIPVADLKAGYQFYLDWVPRGTNERFVRLNYTVATGPMTAGAVTAGITVGHQTNG